MIKSVKKKQRLYIVVFGVVLSTCVLLIAMAWCRKPGFALNKITSSLEPSAKWAIDPLNEWEFNHLRGILSQDFYYLGNGAQCFAFISADGKYVLKFFKIKHLVPKKWLKLIPFPWLEGYRFDKIDKRILQHRNLFTSYKLAYEYLKKETGVVFVHLNKTKDLGVRINLYDRSLNCYTLNLDRFEFVLQKKATLIRDRITSHMLKEDRQGALSEIEALLNHVVDQCKKGYIDRDSGVSNNYGFIGRDVIHFDAGRIVYDSAAKEPSYYHHEVLRVGKKIEDWLSESFPELIDDVEEIINSMIDLSHG